MLIEMMTTTISLSRMITPIRAYFSIISIRYAINRSVRDEIEENKQTIKRKSDCGVKRKGRRRVSFDVWWLDLYRHWFRERAPVLAVQEAWMWVLDDDHLKDFVYSRFGFSNTVPTLITWHVVVFVFCLHINENKKYYNDRIFIQWTEMKRSTRVSRFVVFLSENFGCVIVHNR